MRSGDVMMIRKSAEIASKSSDVQNISGYCQYREAGCKTGSFTIFYTNRFQPEKMFRKYLAKEQGKLRKHSSCAAFGTFPFRCHASRPALQLSCSSVSLSSSSPSNLFLQFVTGKTGGSPIFPNHSDLCHVIPPSHDIL